MMRFRASALIAVLLFAFPALGKQLDNAHWKDRAVWNCAKTVAVEPFSLSGEFKGARTETAYMQYLVSRISAQLAPRGVTITLVKPGEKAAPDVLIKGEFRELSAGSRAARFWIGYGAGTAKVDIRMTGYRPDGKTEIFTFEHARVAPFSLSEDANLGNIDAVAADVAEELLRHREPCDPRAIQPAATSEKAEESNDGARVSIESDVQNADVMIDGKFVGNAPLPDYKLSPGTHTIEVTSAGYSPWKRELTINPGAPTRVVAKLEKVP